MSDDVVDPAFDFDVLRRLVQFAYEHGYHELGYDPVKEIEDRLNDAALAYDKASRSIVSKALLAERDSLLLRLHTSEQAVIAAAEIGLNEQKRLVGQINDLERRLDRGFGMLSTYGVPRERCKDSIANGIDVLATRLSKENQIQAAAINDLSSSLDQERAAYAELEQDKVAADNERIAALATVRDLGGELNKARIDLDTLRKETDDELAAAAKAQHQTDDYARSLQARLDLVAKVCDQSQEKNRELHRRCQLAEGAVLRKMESEQAAGAPLAKRLAIAGYAAEQERANQLERRLDSIHDLACGISSPIDAIHEDIEQIRKLSGRLVETSAPIENADVSPGGYWRRIVPESE